MNEVPMTDVPEMLATRMRLALGDVASTGSGDDPHTDPVRLAAAAHSCLRDALTACDERAAALPLLAADALLTAACESADAGALRRLAAEWAPERLAAMLPA